MQSPENYTYQVNSDVFTHFTNGHVEDLVAAEQGHCLVACSNASFMTNKGNASSVTKIMVPESLYPYESVFAIRSSFLLWLYLPQKTHARSSLPSPSRLSMH